MCHASQHSAIEAEFASGIKPGVHPFDMRSYMVRRVVRSIDSRTGGSGAAGGEAGAEGFDVGGEAGYGRGRAAGADGKQFVPKWCA